MSNQDASRSTRGYVRPLLPWLCASLALNAALAWKISRPLRGGAPADLSASATSVERNAKSTGVTSVPPLDAPSTGASRKIAPPPFAWTQVESADYRQYISNLRAIGCPEQMIRDIVRTDLTQAYAARARQIWTPARVAYWQKATNQTPGPERMKQLRELDREQQEVFKELFGVRSSTQEAYDLVFLQVEGSRSELAFLPAGRSDAAMQALMDAGFEDNPGAHPSPGSKDEKTRFEEKMKILSTVLLPDELEEYRLRNSPAARDLRTELQYFDCTPDEFNQLMELREKSGNPSRDPFNRTAAVQQVRELFGDERAAEYARDTDILYMNARRGAEQNGVPLERVDEAWSVIQQTRASASQLAGNTALPIGDRKRQLDALQQATTKQLEEKLGAAGARNVTHDLGVFFQVTTGNLKP